MDHALADEVLSGNVWADQVSASPDSGSESPDCHQSSNGENNPPDILNAGTSHLESSQSIEDVQNVDEIPNWPSALKAQNGSQLPVSLNEAESPNHEETKLNDEFSGETIAQNGLDPNASGIVAFESEDLTKDGDTENSVLKTSELLLGANSEVPKSPTPNEDDVTSPQSPGGGVHETTEIQAVDPVSPPNGQDITSPDDSSKGRSNELGPEGTAYSELQHAETPSTSNYRDIATHESTQSGFRRNGDVTPEEAINEEITSAEPLRDIPPVENSNNDDDDDFADFEEYHDQVDVQVERSTEINTNKILSEIWPEPLLNDQVPEQRAILDVTSASNTYTNPRKLMNQMTRPMRQFTSVESKPDPIVRWRASAVEGEVLKILQNWREREIKKSRNRLFGWSHKRSSSLGPQKKEENNTTNNTKAPLARIKRTTNSRPSSVVVEPAHYLSSPTISGPNSARTSPGLGSNSDTFENAFGDSIDKTFSSNSSSPIDDSSTKPPSLTTATPVDTAFDKPASALSPSHTGGRSIDSAFSKRPPHNSGPTTPLEGTFSKPTSPLYTTQTGGSATATPVGDAFSKPSELPISSSSTGPKLPSGPTTPLDNAFSNPPTRPISSASIDEMFGMSNPTKPTSTTHSPSMANSIDEAFGQFTTSSTNSIDEAFGSPTSPKIPVPSTMTAQFTNRSQMKPAPPIQPPDTNKNDDDDDDDFGEFEESQPPPPAQPPITLGPMQPSAKEAQQNDTEKVNSIVNSLPDLSFMLN